MDLQEFFCHFQDHLAPKLDAYEQAIYLYIFRHSRLLEKPEITIGFKSARTRMACGVGENGKPMSEGTCYKKLSSLQLKGCITIIRTVHTGRVLRLHLPSEIESTVVDDSISTKDIDIETMDFFAVPENRLLLLKRENFRCFYTLQILSKDSFVIEHVVSRPQGNNSYRNCVASSREANNKKGSMLAEDFLRKLFREKVLNEEEFQDRLEHLKLLQSGALKPKLS